MAEDSKQKKTENVLSGFFHIGIGTAINMVIGFFTTPIITRLVDPTEYGRLSIFNMYISISIMVLCMGLDQALVRYYYKEDTLNYKRWLIFNCSISPILIAASFVTVFSLVVYSFSLPFKFSDSLLLLSFGVVGHLMYRFGTLVLRLEGDNKLYSAVYVANKVIYIVTALALVMLTNWNRFYCLAFSTVFAFCSTAVFSICIKKKNWRIAPNKKYGDITRSELVRYGLPFIVSMGLTTLFQSIDKMSLDHFCDYATVGVYTSAMTIVSVFAIIQTTFNTMWAPMMVKHYEQNPEDRHFYSKYNATISVIMFAFGLTLILFKDVFGLLLGAKYREAAYIVPFLTLEPIMFTISETTVTGIVVKNKSKMHILVGGFACLTNIVGNTILIPLIGPKGAAISTGLSYIVFLIVRTLISNKYYRINYKITNFVTITIITIIFAALNSFIKFGLWTVIVYLLSMIILITLYRDYVKSIIVRAKAFAFSTLKR